VRTKFDIYVLNKSITNDSTQEAIKIYKADRDYPRFYRNFLIKSDNGRFSLRVYIIRCQNAHAYLHEVVMVFQRVLRAFLVLNISEHQDQFSPIL
jgi:hypothetical protein